MFHCCSFHVVLLWSKFPPFFNFYSCSSLFCSVLFLLSGLCSTIHVLVSYLIAPLCRISASLHIFSSDFSSTLLHSILSGLLHSLLFHCSNSSPIFPFIFPISIQVSSVWFNSLLYFLQPQPVLCCSTSYFGYTKLFKNALIPCDLDPYDLYKLCYLDIEKFVISN